VAAGGDNDAYQHNFSLELVTQWQQHTQVAYALQAWKHRPNGNNSVAAQWRQVSTTTAIASWQCGNCKIQSTTAMAKATAMAAAIPCRNPM